MRDKREKAECLDTLKNGGMGESLVVVRQMWERCDCFTWAICLEITKKGRKGGVGWREHTGIRWSAGETFVRSLLWLYQIHHKEIWGGREACFREPLTALACSMSPGRDSVREDVESHSHPWPSPQSRQRLTRGSTQGSSAWPQRSGSFIFPFQNWPDFWMSGFSNLYILSESLSEFLAVYIHCA